MSTATSSNNPRRNYTSMDPEPEMAVSVLTTSSGGNDNDTVSLPSSSSYPTVIKQKQLEESEPEIHVTHQPTAPTAPPREYSYVPNTEPSQNIKHKQASAPPLKANVNPPAVNFAPGTAVAMESPRNNDENNNDAAYAMMQSTKNIQKITEDYSDGTKVVKTTVTHNKRDGTKIITTEEDVYAPQQQPQYHPCQQQPQQQGCECCIVS